MDWEIRLLVCLTESICVFGNKFKEDKTCLNLAFDVKVNYCEKY